MAVTIAAQTAATVQDSQAPLFANLGAAINSAALPPKLLQAVQQVLAQQTSLDPDISGQDIKTAFQKSGLFLETSLASGSVPPAGVAPDLKAALVVLRQALQSALGGPGAAAAAPLPHADAVPPLAPMAAQDLDLQEILLPQARVPVADDLRAAPHAGRAAFAPLPKEGLSPRVTLNLLQEMLQETRTPRARRDCPKVFTAMFTATR